MATKKELEAEVIRLKQELDACQSGEKAIDIIYPNVAKFAQWEELKYSVRSLEKNLAGIQFRLWIVGDKPEWTNDRLVHIPIELSGKTARIDILLKHLEVINHQGIGEEYFWMNDDIYFVNKVTYADMCLPVAVNDLGSNIGRYDRNTVWGRDNLRTIELLKKEKLPLLNYAAHIPHRFEKEKVKLLIARYNMLETPIVLEQIYYNYWFKNSMPYWDTLDLRNNQGFCVNRQNPNWNMFEKQLQVKKYLNNSEAGMNDEFKRRLMKLFPNPSKYEKPE